MGHWSAIQGRKSRELSTITLSSASRPCERGDPATGGYDGRRPLPHCLNDGPRRMGPRVRGDDAVVAFDLLDRADQILDLLGVGPKLPGELVEVGIGDGGEARFVDIGDDLDAPRPEPFL